MPCRLCQIVSSPADQRRPENVLLAETSHFEWVPALGAFVEGYSLILCKDHILSTAALAPNVIQELEEFAEKVMCRLSETYRMGVVLFEHGSAGQRRHAGSCIAHQHLHVVPARLPDLPSILETQFDKLRDVHRLRDLATLLTPQIPYVYYQTSSGAVAAYRAPVLPRQYMRQVLFSSLGESGEWDWRRAPYIDNIHRFLAKLGRSRSC